MTQVPGEEKALSSFVSTEQFVSIINNQLKVLTAKVTRLRAL
jgi:hypothetical protein